MELENNNGLTLESEAFQVIEQPQIGEVQEISASPIDIALAQAEVEKAKALVTLTELLPSLSRGDKIFVKQAARAVFGMEPPKRKGKKSSYGFEGNKSLSGCLREFNISTPTQEVFEMLEKAKIVKKGEKKGYVLLREDLGRTLKAKSEGRPVFTFMGAKCAFETIGLL